MTNVGAEPNGDLPTQRLNELIAAGENAKQEFKSTLRWDLYRKTNSDEITHACVKTIAAFLNSEGGRLLIGVADDGQIVGLEADKFPNTDKFSLHLFNSLQKHIGASAATGVTVEFLRPAESKEVCLLTCTRSLTPVFCRRGEEEHFYVRIGPSTIHLRHHTEFMKYRAIHFSAGMSEPTPFLPAPQTTVITEPRGEHGPLFDSFVSVYEQLFPDPLARPDPTFIVDWLERQQWDADSTTWPELLIVSHVGQEVTGFVQLNYHRTIPFAYGAFLGIAEEWRKTRASMRWLVSQAEEHLLRLQPRCTGVFFEVDPIDSPLIEQWARSKRPNDIANDVIVEQSRRFGELAFSRTWAQRYY